MTSARAAVHMARGRELAFRVVESGRRWRWVINSIGLVSALALAAGVYMYSKWRSEHQAVIDHASASVRRMELEIKYHAAGKLGELNERGWPTSIDTKWFEGTGGMPRNPLVTPNRPWVEVATLEESKLQDPVVRATVDPSLAAFWYNPYLGIVRARVPVMVSDDAAVQVYNRVNGARVSSIFAAGDEATPEQMDDADTIQRSRHRSHEKVEISATGKVVKGR